MFMVGLLSWWYGSGWLQRLKLIKNNLARTADLFSVGRLIGTLFAPFRQISAGRAGGSVSDKLAAFADRTISRFIGALMRIIVIVAGLVAMVLQAVFYGFMFLAWPLIPIIPVIGVIMAIMDWAPPWI